MMGFLVEIEVTVVKGAVGVVMEQGMYAYSVVVDKEDERSVAH